MPAINEELAARVAYRYQSALQIFTLRLFQCLKDWAAFLSTSNCKLRCLIGFGKQLLDFPPSYFFSALCKLKDKLSLAELLAFEAERPHRGGLQFCLHFEFNLKELCLISL